MHSELTHFVGQKTFFLNCKNAKTKPKKKRKKNKTKKQLKTQTKKTKKTKKQQQHVRSSVPDCSGPYLKVHP